MVMSMHVKWLLKLFLTILFWHDLWLKETHHICWMFSFFSALKGNNYVLNMLTKQITGYANFIHQKHSFLSECYVTNHIRIPQTTTRHKSRRVVYFANGASISLWSTSYIHDNVIGYYTHPCMNHIIILCTCVVLLRSTSSSSSESTFGQSLWVAAVRSNSCMYEWKGVQTQNFGHWRLSLKL